MHTIVIGVVGLVVLAGAVAAVAATNDHLLAVGSKAPDVTLKTATGEDVKLSEFVGKSAVVLVFYPGDETPVCTQQLCEIRDGYGRFAEKGAVVFGVNPATATSHEKFAEHRKLPFPLLVDDGGVATKLFGCAGFIMLQRTVYVIGKDGAIIYAKRGKPPVSEILNALP